MERIDIRSPSSQAKLLGTIITICGAMLFTFYQGPALFHTIPLPDSSNRLLLSQTSNWIYGGLILVIGGIDIAIWSVLQAVFSLAIRISAITWCLKKKGPVFVAMFSPLQIGISVIMGVTFLGDSLYLGSAIGATIISCGFYTVMWGQARENTKSPLLTEDDLVADEPDHTIHLLASTNESTC